jgi:signal transduction histidine kinase
MPDPQSPAARTPPGGLQAAPRGQTDLPRGTTWYRSLYWRIAAGFIATLAILLMLQTALFLWLTGRFTESFSGRSPQEIADLVARELSEALTDKPDLDIDAFLRERFDEVHRPFAVVMRDGRRASNRPGALPPGFGERVGRRGGPPPFGDRFGFPPRPDGDGSDPTRRPDQGGPAEPRRDGIAPPAGDRPPPPPDFDDRRRRGGRGGPGGGPPLHLSPIVVGGTQIGHVAIPSGPPPMEVMLRELGPTLTWSGLGLLAVGSVLAALAIFGPARKRLASLEHAARALGEGQTDVRADERGGDEVTALAHAFNQMAGELESRSEALAASDRARRHLLADVSHELMTPLTAIRGYTQTLAMPGLTMAPAARARYFDIVDQETYKLEAIIGDLLDLAKLEGGGGTLTLEAVPVRELFNRVADRHMPTLDARRIVLSVEAPGDLAVRGDLQRLEQAIQNVAANAIRHAPDGGRIELRAHQDDAGIHVTVRDNGPGIPPEHLPHVFDRFYKADASRTTSTPEAGSGLGLSIVRAIVERHGGTVTAANSPEGGAIFEMNLPKA